MNTVSRLTKWDARFLDLAKHVASWSKDPSTQVGAVITRPDHTIASVGYNGFPRGVEDNPKALGDRETKLARTVHAEVNAILSSKEDIDGCSIYTWPLMPCSHCAAAIINAGIVQVVAPKPDDSSSWQDSFKHSITMFEQAWVNLVLYTPWESNNG